MGFEGLYILGIYNVFGYSVPYPYCVAGKRRKDGSLPLSGVSGMLGCGVVLMI